MKVDSFSGGREEFNSYNVFEKQTPKLAFWDLAKILKKNQDVWLTQPSHWDTGRNTNGRGGHSALERVKEKQNSIVRTVAS